MFQRTLGDTSDILFQESFKFMDNKTEVILRPENTAGVIRALGHASNQKHRLFYLGPMFRRERPQKGRFRQFSQCGIEHLGEEDPLADVEAILLATSFLNALGVLDHTTLQINSLGTSDSRLKYTAALLDFLTPLKQHLSPLSQGRLERGGALRILDSKEAQDRALVDGTHAAGAGPAPLLSDFLEPEDTERFQQVLANLDALGVNYTVNPLILRGLDYYQQTAFEFLSTHNDGRQSAVLAGGRYDGLLQSMSQTVGTSQPGVGWAAGIERLVLLIDEIDGFPRDPSPLVCVVVARSNKDTAVDRQANTAAMSLAHSLRSSPLLEGARVHLDYKGNLKRQLTNANKQGAALCVILGEDELAGGTITVRNMVTKEQRTIPHDQLQGHLQEQMAVCLHLAEG